MLADLALLALVGAAMLLLAGLVWLCDWLAR